MPNPKDPEKLAAYREKLRAIALARGYGKWMQGRSFSSETVAKMREKQIAIGRDPEERKRRSQRARANGTGKWMKGRTLPQEVKEKIVAHRRAKTYLEIYGERAAQEASKRRESNRARWKDVPRQTQREKHNADYRYSDWRKAVFERDNYTCCVCGEHSGELQAHHIQSWAKHPELRYDVDNGMTVHKGKCHRAADKQTRQNEKN
jgi:5-methylcytosine-specific restriction endonuclease McrA